jgi:hypothetical protein
MYWNDYDVIKLDYLFESLNKIGLGFSFDAQLRLWVNTGTVNVTVRNPDAANCGYNLIPADNTFSNTCPIMINYHAGSTGTGIVPAITQHTREHTYSTRERTKNSSWFIYCTPSYYIICRYQFSRKCFSTPSTHTLYAHPLPNCRLYCSRTPTTSLAGISLAANVLAHPLHSCRLYYSQVTVDPQKSIDYLQRNRNKKVMYRSFVTNNYRNITSGSSYNALVKSGIVHPTVCNYWIK